MLQRTTITAIFAESIADWRFLVVGEPHNLKVQSRLSVTSFTAAIHAAVDFSRAPTFVHPTLSERFDGLDAEARAWIGQADSCFVASYADEGARTVDVSHRSGRAGFIDVDGDTLTFPDFFGNRFFNTLGNMLVNPSAGLLFIDFATGDLLQLTGRTEVFLDGPEVEAFDGAEKVWRFHVQHAVRRRGALALGGAGRDFSAEAERTSTWEESRQRRR